jgi:hypothetical protein
MSNSKPTIYLALVDDWELSGNGSGDVRELQFEPMRKLVDIYQACGIHGSFNVEVMQQLSFRQNETMHPELKTLADEWDENVRETFRRGHDVQLHVHPQWLNATYADGKWKLTGDWSILNYSAEDALRMLEAGKRYLEELLRPIDSTYRCLSFRSGAWCIAPSPHMLSLLVKLGIVFDMSIVAGVRYDTRRIMLDYTNCEEEFLPYYPVMTDARKVSAKAEPIICVPTNCFYASRRQVLTQHLKKIRNTVKQRVATTTAAISVSRSAEVYGAEWAEAGASRFKRIYEKGITPYVKGKHLISDLAQLDYALLNEMLASIRKRARSSGDAEVPVILENHTKDVGDFSDIKRFLNEVSTAPDIRFLTLSELAGKLRDGRFKIRTAKP